MVSARCHEWSSLHCPTLFGSSLRSVRVLGLGSQPLALGVLRSFMLHESIWGLRV